MPEYAAFLRAVNLGPTRKVSGADLRSLFEGFGFDDVGTFRTSGNVVFGGAGREAPAKLTARIEKGLEEALGYDVDIFLRTAAEVRAIAGHEPFAPDAIASSKGKLQVALLSSKPSAAVRKDVLALDSDDDRLAFGERELYWLPSGGTQQSQLDLRTIGKLVGRTTVRTMGTMQQLAAKYFAG